MTIDKTKLLAEVLGTLGEKREQLAAYAEQTRVAATHEESRAENDKDTRGLEASYLARGQAKRVADIDEAIKRIRFMVTRSFSENDTIGLSALIRLERDGEELSQLHFFVPAGGGMEMEFSGRSIRLITPASPLGKALAGKELDDEFILSIGGKKSEYTIVAFA